MFLFVSCEKNAQVVALAVTIAMSSLTGRLMAITANALTPPNTYMSDEDAYEVAEDFPKKSE